MNASSPELFYCTFPTPAGPFALAVDPEGALTVTAFGGLEQLQARANDATARFTESAEKTAAPRREVEAYFTDHTHAFRAPVARMGSPFQQRVWTALNAIPPGETRTYGGLAKELKSSPRAIGRANATNPVCLFVPCHRVIGGDGKLTGYAFGEELKAKLLEHEGVTVERDLRGALDLGPRSSPNSGCRSSAPGGRAPPTNSLRVIPSAPGAPPRRTP